MKQTVRTEHYGVIEVVLTKTTLSIQFIPLSFGWQFFLKTLQYMLVCSWLMSTSGTSAENYGMCRL